MPREYVTVTLEGAPYLADVSLDNPGELYLGEGDEVTEMDCHARLYDVRSKRLVGVYCAHSKMIDHDPVGSAHICRSGSTFCPHSQMREPCQ